VFIAAKPMTVIARSEATKQSSVLTLTLTEVRGFGFAEINKLAPELSMEGEAFRLKMNLILKTLI